jgi:hypothetical protein
MPTHLATSARSRAQTPGSYVPIETTLIPITLKTPSLSGQSPRCTQSRPGRPNPNWITMYKALSKPSPTDSS